MTSEYRGDSALVRCQNLAGPYTTGKTIGSGDPLKLLVPSPVGNYRMAPGKTWRYGYKLKDWAILSGFPNPYLTWYGSRATTG